jgi:nucleotide-binding universal stress UspA family protein
MRNLLVPIDPDNTARTRSAIAEAVRIYREDPVAIRLLRVEPRVSGHVATFFGHGELHQLQQACGEEDLQFARSLLDAAGVPYTTTVLVGRGAETIARAAHDLGCDRILLGEEDAHGLGSRVFGSLAHQVRHLPGAGEFQVIGS